MKLLYVVLNLAFFFLLSCEGKENIKKSPGQKLKKSESVVILKKNTNVLAQRKDFIFQSKYLAVDDFLVNGNKMIQSKTEFYSDRKKIDSTSSELWECGSPFDWLD